MNQLSCNGTTVTTNHQYGRGESTTQDSFKHYHKKKGDTTAVAKGVISNTGVNNAPSRRMDINMIPTTIIEWWGVKNSANDS